MKLLTSLVSIPLRGNWGVELQLKIPETPPIISLEFPSPCGGIGVLNRQGLPTFWAYRPKSFHPLAGELGC